MGKLTDWIRGKLGHEDRVVPGPEPVEEGTKRKRAPVDQWHEHSGLPGYESRHGRARALRYWHRHLSHTARTRKRALRRIANRSRQTNRR